MSAHKVGKVLLILSKSVSQVHAIVCHRAKYKVFRQSYLYEHLPILRIHVDNAAGPHTWMALVSTEHDRFKCTEEMKKGCCAEATVARNGLGDGTIRLLRHASLLIL